MILADTQVVEKHRRLRSSQSPHELGGGLGVSWTIRICNPYFLIISRDTCIVALYTHIIETHSGSEVKHFGVNTGDLYAGDDH